MAGQVAAAGNNLLGTMTHHQRTEQLAQHQNFQQQQTLQASVLQHLS